VFNKNGGGTVMQINAFINQNKKHVLAQIGHHQVIHVKLQVMIEYTQNL
jgi:hypothetical protein